MSIYQMQTRLQITKRKKNAANQSYSIYGQMQTVCKDVKMQEKRVPIELLKIVSWLRDVNVF